MAGACRLVGVNVTTGRRWMREAGGVIPQRMLQELSSRYLGPVDRATIMVGRKQGMSVRDIAAMLGRSPSTVSREVQRNRRPSRPYDARQAQLWAEDRSARPQPTKLSLDEKLHGYVQSKLNMKWSPEQISHLLKMEFPAEERMRVSHETIYQALYVQARGSLKRELEAKLRTGRTLRKPRNHADDDLRGKNRFPGMVMIADRPAEIEDRAVPGHWEGDLIIGSNNGSQIGTLVERTTRYTMLVHLPATREPDVMNEALARSIQTLPQHLMKSLTWDQGVEMGHHQNFTIATDLAVYFCDPHSPWQRGTNENTNGLLRQYFPKGTDLSVHSAEHLAFVAHELNGRPRKTLGWKTPAQALDELLLSFPRTSGVATTT